MGVGVWRGPDHWGVGAELIHQHCSAGMIYLLIAHAQMSYVG